MKEALGKHAECWGDAEIDPAGVAPAVAKAATMGHESTAVERISAISDRIERFYECDNV